jgi:hypothetical protein
LVVAVDLAEVTGLAERGVAEVAGRHPVDPGQERRRVRVAVQGGEQRSGAFAGLDPGHNVGAAALAGRRIDRHGGECLVDRAGGQSQVGRSPVRTTESGHSGQQ